MGSKRGAVAQPPISDRLLDPPDTSLLDLLDRVLNKGVMANGDLTIGVAAARSARPRAEQRRDGQR
jgi:hypothetical protein